MRIKPSLGRRAWWGRTFAAGRQCAKWVRFLALPIALAATLAASGCVGVAGKSSTNSQTSPAISVAPASINFGTVTVGTTSSQSVTVSNTGNASLSVSQAQVTGTGFGVTGATFPMTIAAGGRANFSISFKPSAASNYSGSITVTSNAASSPSTIMVGGSGTTQTLQLVVNPTTLAFGNVNVGASSTLDVTLENTGNGNFTVSQGQLSGAGFSASGVGSNLSLSPGQSATLAVMFSPSVAGNASGSVAITSNAPPAPVTVSFTGTGVQTTSHSVALNWTASTSSVIGYNVYRSSLTSGPFVKVNSSLASATNYTDATVQAGQTYFYVVTSVNSQQVESSFSNQVSVAVPTP